MNKGERKAIRAVTVGWCRLELCLKVYEIRPSRNGVYRWHLLSIAEIVPSMPPAKLRIFAERKARELGLPFIPYLRHNQEYEDALFLLALEGTSEEAD